MQNDKRRSQVVLGTNVKPINALLRVKSDTFERSFIEKIYNLVVRREIETKSVKCQSNWSVIENFK